MNRTDGKGGISELHVARRTLDTDAFRHTANKADYKAMMWNESGRAYESREPRSRVNKSHHHMELLGKFAAVWHRCYDALNETPHGIVLHQTYRHAMKNFNTSCGFQHRMFELQKNALCNRLSFADTHS